MKAQRPVAAPAATESVLRQSLRDEFLSGQIRVRGAKKVMAQMMFGVLALSVAQLLRRHQ